MPEIVTKRCTKCKKELPISLFDESSRSSDGYSGACNICKGTIEVEERVPTTLDVTPEEEQKLLAEMLGEGPYEPEKKPAKPKTKMLRQSGSGFLYVWTAQLAKRPDMEPVDE